MGFWDFGIRDLGSWELAAQTDKDLDPGLLSDRDKDLDPGLHKQAFLLFGFCGPGVPALDSERNSKQNRASFVSSALMATLFANFTLFANSTFFKTMDLLKLGPAS